MNPQRDCFLLPKGLPSVMEPGTVFEITFLSAQLERWIFRATRQSEIRELLLHKVRGGIAMNVGRGPVLFVVGEIQLIIEFRLVYMPAVIVRGTSDGRGFVRRAVEGQSVDELITAIETDLGER